MKKTPVLIAVLFALISFSCEEDFNPKADFEKKYILYCIADYLPKSNYIAITAAVTSTFDVDGMDPELNTKDPFIPKAEITINYQKTDYKMHEDTIKFIPNFLTKYLTRKIKYSGYIFNVYSSPGNTMYVTSRLPNGKTLSAKTVIPFFPEYEFSYPFVNGISTSINRFLWGNSWKIDWEAKPDYLYTPKLVLNYYILTDDGFDIRSKEIPLRYVKKDNKYVPVYPGSVTNGSLEYLFDSIDSTMAQISAGDPNKEKYHILNIIFSNTVFNSDLAIFWSSIHGALDDYSIRLDESTYTNINDGMGVFGCMTSLSREFKVNIGYARQFGYQSD